MPFTARCSTRSGCAACSLANVISFTPPPKPLWLLDFFLFRFSARDANLGGVQHHHVVAGVDVRRVLGLVLAAQARRDLRREPPQDLALRVHHQPAVPEIVRLRRESRHCVDAKRVRILLQKKAQLARVAPNPPKEEGGGDNRSTLLSKPL